MGKVAVLGLGPSLKLFEDTFNEYTNVIGVNDIWRYYKTDAVVCVDKPSAFSPDRLMVINASRPNYFYSQLVIWESLRHDFRKINIIPGYPYKDISLDGPDYYKSYCSPYIACQIAYKIYKASEIHLFGVDLTNHPKLDRVLCAKIKEHFSYLKKALTEKNCRLIVLGSGILTVQL